MKLCAICKKGSVTGGKRAFLRSHYNPTRKIRRYPNLQWATLPADFVGRRPLRRPEAEALTKTGITGGKRVKVCTKCLKKIHKNYGT